MQAPVFLCSFDPLGHQLAHVSSDNRIRIWEVVTGQLRSNLQEPNHLIAQYTCLAWGNAPSTEKQSKKRNRKQATLLALGTERGTVVVWDTVSSEVKFRLGGEENKADITGHSKRVTDVAFDGQSLLYSCSEDKLVIAWDLKTGNLADKFKAGKQALRRIALLRKNPRDPDIIVATSSMKQYKLSSKEVVKKFSGHAGPVSLLHLSEDGRYLVSASNQDDRVLNLWDVEEEEEEVSLKKAFTVDSRPVAVDSKFAPSSQAAIQHEFLVVTEAGTLAVFRYPPSGSDAKKPSQSPDIVIKEGAGYKDTASTLFAGQFCGVSGRTGTKRQVLIARGSTAKPVFERVDYLDSKDEPIKSVELKPLENISSLLLPVANGTAATNTAKGPAKVLGPTDVQLPAPKPIPEDSEPADGDSRKEKAKRKRKEKGGRSESESEPEARPATPQASGQSEEMIGVDPEDPIDEDNIEAPDTVTLEERIRSLGLEDKATKGPKSNVLIPKASSVGVLLSQALQSNDASLIEECLRIRDVRVIKSTVERLPTSYVLPFFKKIVTKFEESPSRGIYLIDWIRAVVVCHTAYLVSLPDLASSLSSLYQLIDTRLAAWKRLLALSGRLELLGSQMKDVAKAGQAQSKPVHRTPLTVYDEGEEDEGHADANSDAESESAEEEDDGAEAMDDEGEEADSDEEDEDLVLD